MSEYEPAKCAACGVPWPDHLGIEGTCAKLLEARKALEQAMEWMGVVGAQMGPQDERDYPELAAALKGRT